MEKLTNFLLFKPLILKTIVGYEFFECHEIIRFEADRKFTLVFITNKFEPVIALNNISTINAMLPISEFYRCHRSHIINVRHIKKFYIKGHQLIMINGNEVPVAEDKVRQFKETIFGAI
jgi:two-component system, LytTR family, response regulator